MCNAFNHSWGCTCGWGGEGHLGRRGPGGYSFRPIARTWETVESYVNPNGTCPNCHQLVFISQTPDGRRVLLDELGPPWPTHACSGKAYVSRQPQPGLPITQNRFAWQKSGWNPFIVAAIVSVSPDLLRIGGLAGKANLDLYLGKRQFGTVGDLREEIQRSAVHIRAQTEERFRMSALLPPARIVEVDAYISSIEAQNSVATLRKASRHPLASRTRPR